MTTQDHRDSELHDEPHDELHDDELHDDELHDDELHDAVAVIALAGRFPGAPTIEAFWRNLRDGVESVRAFTDDELAAAGVPEHERRSPGYVPAKAVLDDIAGFDAGYFGMSPREAALIDPQQRLFLEVCVELLERAALGPGEDRARVAVFGGVSKNTYLFFNLLSHPELRQSPAALQTLGANDKDYLATRVSHKLGLRGPSMAVQTACSSSLTAVHLACQSLLSGESEYAIAGGVSVDVPHISGYVHEPGGIFSPDGHCRAFDAGARGTVFGQGAGAVLLRRLPDALESGDDIHAVIRGTAVNNDGSDKAGFTAPGVEGQSAAVVEALANAGVDPSTVSYVEAHGTATPIGDPIEIEALTRAYRLWTDRTGFCRIGSVKTNIGHLNAASGIAGLIKTVLALRHGEIPPSLHFRRPNPRIPFEETPFRVVSELEAWTTDGGPRRAGVSSFGIGGTNVHVVLEAAPQRPRPPAGTGWHLIPLSAATPAALATLTGELARAVEERPELALADVAHTHQTGRRRFPYRTAVLAGDRDGAVRALGAASARSAVGQALDRPSVAFLFSGQGAQYPELARGLYAGEPVFRREMDECGEVLRGLGAADPCAFMRSSKDPAGLPDAGATEVAQPLLFSVGYALARLWESWGVRPDAVAGHSVGELTAAAVAGVLERDDALRLVAERARLMGEAPRGAMLAVACAAEDLPLRLPATVGIGAVNTETQIVLSGPEPDIEKVAHLLAQAAVPCRPLPNRHAFHSAAMADAASALASFAARLRLHKPRVPIASNITGGWYGEAEALDPGYWGRHLREPVRFSDCAGTLLSQPDRLFLEVGPGRTLGRLVRQHASWSAAGHRAVASLPDRPDSGKSDQQAMLLALGALWEHGVEPAWSALHRGGSPRPVALPTYPFERTRHWIDPAPEAPAGAPAATAVREPSWPVEEPVPVPAAAAAEAPGVRRSLADVEARVIGVFETLLGVEGVSAGDDFFALGGNSLLGVEMVTRMRDATGVELTLTAMFDQPTPGAIAALIRTALREGVDEALAGVGVDSADDIRLEDTLPLTLPPGRPAPGAPRSVLLTGATGFLGTFLLHELLRQTGAVVHCLVRSPDAGTGRDRLVAGLRRYGLLDTTDLSRIDVVPGDIAKDGFGLPAEEYARLSRTVDAVYHNGAKVSFLEPYRLIRRTNVKAVHEVLRFAAEHTLKPVHHVSTIAVFDCAKLNHVMLAGEDEDLGAGGGFHGGYDESKWVAERILGLARRRGFPVTIYRPGNIAGHSATGAVSDGHLVSAMIKGCVALGLSPDVDPYLDVVPVDYVSRALVHLSLRASAQGKNFHLVNPAFVRWGEITGHLRAAGYPMKPVSLDEWRDVIRARGDADNPMRVFLPMLDERPLFSGRRYRCDRTLAELEGSGITCPPLDARLIDTYLRWLTGAGELPAPPDAGEAGDGTKARTTQGES